MRRVILVLLVGLSLVWSKEAHGQTLAQFHTPLGDWLVELYDTDKPVTVSNFLHYVNSGAYHDMFMHRWVPGFVVQGGGYYVTNRHTTNADFAGVPSFGDITNEYGVGRTFSNTYGTIAMARLPGQTNSANSQWFLNLTNNAFLDAVDGGFTVFGHVVVGTNALELFNDVTTSHHLYQLNLGATSPFSQLPVLLASPTNQATFDDLIFTTITFPARPTLAITTAPGGAINLSWRSLSNFVNHVELATNLPPTWQTLVATNGSGDAMQMTITNPSSARAFYRVRLE